MNIVLIGMRGSGKSTVAKLLAKRLDKQYIELDSEIAERNGMSIREMVAKHGWDYFRDRESEAVREVAKNDDAVISTGGGVVTRAENVEALKQNGFCIYLRTPIEVLVERIGEAHHLPRLTEKKTMREEMEEVMKVRAPLYENAADEIVDTEALDLEGVVHEVVQRLQKGNIVA